MDCIVLSVSSAVGQLFIFYTISKFGAVVFTIMMTVRQVSLICFIEKLNRYIVNNFFPRELQFYCRASCTIITFHRSASLEFASCFWPFLFESIVIIGLRQLDVRPI